jgi:hypothetical protein
MDSVWKMNEFHTHSGLVFAREHVAPDPEIVLYRVDVANNTRTELARWPVTTWISVCGQILTASERRTMLGYLPWEAQGAG